MIKLFGNKIPNEIYVACSGGADSMCAAHFLAQKPYRTVHLLFVDHGTATSSLARNFLEKYGREAVGAHSLTVKTITTDLPPRVSQEEHWRNERYKVFKSVYEHTGFPIVTAHHLDDSIETYLFNMLNGKQHGIAYRHGPVIRPFLMTRSQAMRDWCQRHGIFWTEDLSNNDTKYMRNYIRHELMPHAKHVNPGLHKVVARHTGTDWN